MDLKTMMKLAMEADQEEKRSKLAPDVEAMRLRDSLGALLERHVFAVGQVVRQKKLAPVYKAFGDNDLAIVVEVLAEPIIGSGDAGSPHDRERYDLIVGSLERGREFCLYHVDSRRFEPVYF